MKKIIKNVLVIILLFGSTILSASAKNSKNNSSNSNAPTVAMIGVYTVNPAAAPSATNFIRIGQADTAMMTNGIAGPVTIQIFNGTYNQPNLTLNTVAGASSTNSIKFTSFSNDSLQVNITSLFQVINVPYVTLEKLRFTGSNSYLNPSAIQFGGTSNNITIKSCNITGRVTWNAGSGFTLTNNYLVGGVQVTGLGGAYINNILLKNNIVLNGSRDGNDSPFILQCFNVTKPVLDANTFQDFNFNHVSGAYAYKATFYFVGCSDTLFIKYNRFIRCGTSRLIGDYDTNPTVTTKLAHVEMFNNFITAVGQFRIGTSDLSAGVGVTQSMRYYYNNFYNIVSTNATSGFSFGSIGSSSFESGVSLCKNNIFASKYTAIPYYRSAAYPANSDNNSLYTTGPTLVQAGANYATLTAYKAAGFEPNSIAVNPKYFDSSNLHVQHPSLLSAGVPAPTSNPLLVDIDNDNRNALNPAIGADEPMIASNDVIAKQLLLTKTDFVANTTQQLNLRIVNNGGAILNQVKVRWSIDGLEQLPAYTWAGSLAYDSATTLNFGSYNFAMMKYTNLKVWTDLPNTAPDAVPVNDTLRLDSIMPFARGNFTIGGLAATVPSFTKAAEYLAYGGLDSAVVINIANGKYTEQPTLKYVRGASATNPIIFKGLSGLANADTLTFGSTGTGVNPYTTLRLDSAVFINFKNITIQSLNTNSQEVEFRRNCRFINFDSCVFTALATNGNRSHIYYDANDFYFAPIDSNVNFTNNLFNGGYGGIKIKAKNVTIKGNRFSLFNTSSTDIAIDISGSFTAPNNIIIDSNVVNFTTNGAAINLNQTVFGNGNNISITRNKLYSTGNTGISIGQNYLLSAANPIKIYNNFISLKNSGTALRTYANFTDISHNSFSDSTYSGSDLVDIIANNVTLRNNILAKNYAGPIGQYYTTGTALKIGTANISTLTSTNNLYAVRDRDTATLINNGSTTVSLSQWKTATGKDVNSIKSTSAFINELNDLHINKNKPGAVDVAKKATPLSTILFDIDDSTRSPTMPCIGSDEFTLNQVDAGVSKIIGLAYPMPAGNNTPIVAIRNYGTDVVTSATINWSVNNVAQTPYIFVGSIASGDSVTNITLSPYNFIGTQAYTIKCFTTNVNGGADVNTLNDTITKIVYPAMCGGYTIAGTLPDFAGLKNALSYATLAGINCPVVLNVRDGQYNESDTITNILGTTAFNTFTIQSESLDSSKVTFYQTDGFINSSPYAVLRIDNAKYIKLNKIGIKRTLDPLYHFYFDVIAVANEATGLAITNCDIASVGPGAILAYQSPFGSVISDINITNNNFTGGNTAISLTGTSGIGLMKNVGIKNNKFRKPLYNSNATQVNLTYLGNLIFDSNFLDSTAQSAGQVQGLSLQYSVGKISITNNKILKRKGQNGMYFNSVAGLNFADSAVIIANNFITIDSVANNVAAMYCYYMGRNVKVVYNNLLNNCYGSSSSSAALYYTTGFSAGTFKDTITNNNITQTGVGFGLIETQSTPGDINSTNNNIYSTTGTKLAYYNNTQYNTIASLATASGTHTASVSMNPLYISNSDLHVTELALRTLGKPLNYVLNDIDNDVRNVTNTTIGADEIIVNNLDIGVAGLLSPTLPFAAGNQNINVSLKNYGATTITSATINWSINGILQTPFNYSGSLAFNNVATVTLINYNFLIDSAYNIKFYTSNPNAGVDANTANDSTMVTNFYTALSGGYTIGGLTPQFKTFGRSAINLKYGGMLGNVIFNIRDGVYNEALKVDSIPFQNNFATTWQSESGDSSKVTLTYSPTIADNVNAVVHFNNTKNLIIKKITVQAKLPLNSNYAAPSFKSIIYFSAKNKNILLQSNRIIDSTFFTYPYDNNTGARFIYNRDETIPTNNNFYRSYDSSIVIDKNYFKQTNLNGNPIIDLSGVVQYNFNNTIILFSNYLNNCTVSNNKFDLYDISKYTILIGDVDSLKFISNKITGRSVLSGKDYLVIDKNDFYHEGNNQVALTVAAGTGRAANKPCIISNNTVQTKVVGFFNADNVNNSACSITGDRVNFIHNTVVASDTGYLSGYGSYAALNLIGNLDTVKNNVFYNVNGGYLLNTTCTNLNSNYNNYVYTNHFSSNANSLTQYKAVTGQDANSAQNINPYFRGATDLHASNILLKAAPAPVPTKLFFTADVDGQPRAAFNCYGADEFLQPLNDMVVLDASPAKIFPEGLNDIKIHVYNNGSNAITSFNAIANIDNYNDVTYNYTNAGNLNYNFSGAIAPGAEVTITLGQINIPMRKNIFKINTYNLNGIGDEVPYTDSLQNNNYYAGFNGTYSFQNNTAPNTSVTFNSFVAAAKQLSAGGVYGPSTLNLMTGLHNTSFNIDSIPNRGAISPLIIQSQNGDSSSTGFITDPGGNVNLKIFKASYVTVKNLYFGMSASGLVNNYQIALGFNSQNINFENNKIVNDNNAVSGANNGGTNAIFVAGNWGGQKFSSDSNFTFKNNLIIGGQKGINAYGALVNGFTIKNVNIIKNTFLNQYNTGVVIDGVIGSLIDSNKITTNSTNNQCKGIDIVASEKLNTISKNSIYIGNDGYGIYNFPSAQYYLSIDTLQVYNNFITVGQNQASKGLYIAATNGKQVKVMHNSINNRSTNAASGAFYYSHNFNTTTGRALIINNIFSNKSLGLPVEILNYNNSAYINQKNNNLYTLGSLFGKINGNSYSSLATLAATGIDYNSVTGDPLFLADDDLHVDCAVVNNTGSLDANPYVKTDIDNENRNSNNPDIGADEFSLPNFGAVQLETPLSSCSHSSTETVKAYIKNFGTTARTNIPVAYRINMGAAIVDTVRTTINAGDSVLFTFTQTANLAAPQDYYIDVWSNYRGDSIPSNDTLKQFLVATTPANNILPYYTGFEGTPAGWYTGGQNSSFKWGVIFSGVIDSAANGLNAWKSNLTGPHKNNEFSYLYSPCFDLSATTVDPTLNFNLAFQLENNIDKAWVEISTNAGATWSKLGAQGEGLGWYNNAGNYWTGNSAYFHNAKHLLPITALANKSSVRIRFVLQTNGSIVQDGLAIDDVSIYTGTNAPVSAGTYIGRMAVSTGTATFIQVNDPSGNRIIELNDNGQNLGNITVDVNQNAGNAPTFYNGNSYLGRSFVIKVQNQPTAPVSVRLFITQAEFDAWKLADPSINQVRSIAVYKFSGTIEDFSLANNTAGTPLTIQPAQVTKIPYLDGYFLEFTVSSFSEFWITKGTPLVVLPVKFVNVQARLQNNTAAVNWQVANEQNVARYDVLHSTNGSTFNNVGSVNYQGGNSNYSFIHNQPQYGINYYQIKQIDIDNKFALSNIVRVDNTKAIIIKIYPTVFTNSFIVENGNNINMVIQLFGVDGKLYKQQSLQPGTNTIQTLGLAKGVYIYKIMNGKAIIQTNKIIKQ